MSEVTTEKGLTGWHVLIIFIIAMGVVFVVNFFFAWAAIKTHTGVDVNDAYTLGLAYNDHIAEREVQAELGWRAEAALVSTGPAGEAVLVVTMRDATGAPLTGLSVAGLVRRPVEAQSDQDVTLTEVRPGRYEAVLLLPFPGRWQTRLRAEDGAEGRLDIEEVLWLE